MKTFWKGLIVFTIFDKHTKLFHYELLPAPMASERLSYFSFLTRKEKSYGFCSNLLIPNFLISCVGGFQDSAASAFGPHHCLFWPIPCSGAWSGILPGPGPLPPLHCPVPTAAACHLWPAPPGHADPHCPFQSHIQEGKGNKVSNYRTEDQHLPLNSVLMCKLSAELWPFRLITSNTITTSRRYKTSQLIR